MTDQPPVAPAASEPPYSGGTLSGDALRQGFRTAFAGHPAGVAVLSAQGPQGPVALTVSSLISISDDPPTVACSLSRRSSSTAAILAAESLVIHFLKRKDVSLARACATPGLDRFADRTLWSRLPTGEPYFTAVATLFRARITNTLPLDDATLIVAELTDGRVSDDHASGNLTMVYLNRRWHALGPASG